MEYITFRSHRPWWRFWLGRLRGWWNVKRRNWSRGNEELCNAWRLAYDRRRSYRRLVRELRNLLFEQQMQHQAAVMHERVIYRDKLNLATAEYRADAIKRIQPLLDAAVKIDFRHDYMANFYQVSVRFDTRLPGCFHGDRDMQRLIAHQVAARIEVEISSGHFVQTVHEQERRHAEFVARKQYEGYLNGPGS